MTNYFDTRTSAFTNAEFRAIPRNSDGDIIDFEDAAVFITAAQRDKLTGDDQSRMEDFDEELRCLRAEFD